MSARILVVDDEPLYVRLLEETLKIEGRPYIGVRVDMTSIFKISGRKEFIIRAFNDSDLGSWFFVDDIAVRACYPQ